MSSRLLHQSSECALIRNHGPLAAAAPATLHGEHYANGIVMRLSERVDGQCRIHMTFADNMIAAAKGVAVAMAQGSWHSHAAFAPPAVAHLRVRAVNRIRSDNMMRWVDSITASKLQGPEPRKSARLWGRWRNRQQVWSSQLESQLTRGYPVRFPEALYQDMSRYIVCPHYVQRSFCWVCFSKIVVV